ncbi:4-hydroxy-3-methylbut-2-enyl diphosphate reductase [Methylotenera sp.]|uniref:4-hydroxy-3-methylbut-2-enyl diphosphate reductase n=1 Tax=Methylotenera sp. TaxID=2051956 RepID=UPI002725CB6C|nr:4-hydroxy-3-methylbut-2-enyl diphosphate reductase [Methylotenera sp.]MDO9394242.1 4-hydroxy-3-methylbut-2-enyl diphosphate reductase [Methylotenera sp.]MDP1523397.1 4-hydroxy-3-methylbut-2-enyl diphosphate reductase [Methylotenera sp.]MDP2070534.1 4-hydroxy-3-methylbut-2-enyl diphosphate reductase [Methylotenera sp.]MDP3006135.1 4-hydroxy-3-methylbut-2-enyl diphosphate reductase [Methylotenera sp.]MDP3306795.1 4-hydroxy-3-methylbut-2-enyl diphosphate reductase [Methylotenera sp.]
MVDNNSTEKTSADILLANPRGFCAGVDRAIIIVEQALEKFGAPIYVRHEVVHNKFVVDELRAKGAVFVEELDEIPTGSTVIFSAHGVSKAVRAEAESRGLTAFDATCPLVTKVHIEVAKMRAARMEIIMIGHKGHPEVEGTMGQIEGDPANAGIYLVETPEDVTKLTVKNPLKLAFVTQTTLSMDDAAQVINALKTKFPEINAPKSDDICYATQNRQDAVKIMAKDCDLVIIVGSPNSSNSNRLREVAANQGIEAYMVDNASYLKAEWLVGKKKIGVSAGASAPEILVNEVIVKLQQLGAGHVQELQGVIESVVFQLPKNLTQAKNNM